MTNVRRLLAVLAVAMLHVRPGNAQVFGTQDYNVTTIPAVTFTGGSFTISGSVGRYGNPNVDQHFYAPLEIPLSAVIDYIGINNLNDGTPGTIIVSFLDRSAAGSFVVDESVASQPHTNWQTDKNSTAFNL